MMSDRYKQINEDVETHLHTVATKSVAFYISINASILRKLASVEELQILDSELTAIRKSLRKAIRGLENEENGRKRV